MTQTQALPIPRQPETLGGWIKYARIEAGYLQDQVANYCNVSRGLVAQWETDIKQPNAAQLGALVRMLEADYLFLIVRDLPRPEKSKPRGRASKSGGVTQRSLVTAA